MIKRTGHTCSVILNGMAWEFEKGESKELPDDIEAGLVHEDKLRAAKDNSKPRWEIVKQAKKTAKPANPTTADEKKGDS